MAFGHLYFLTAIKDSLNLNFKYQYRPIKQSKISVVIGNGLSASTTPYIIFHIRENDGVVLSGWGSMTKHGNISPKLQQARLIIEPQTLCNTSYEQVHSAIPLSLQIKTALPDLFQSNLLCAGSEVCRKLSAPNHV